MNQIVLNILNLIGWYYNSVPICSDQVPTLKVKILKFSNKTFVNLTKSKLKFTE